MADYVFSLPPPNPRHRSQYSTAGDSTTQRDQWIWRPSDLRNTPSRKSGIGWEAENLMRGRAINWIVRISVSLQLPQLIIATASVYVHRFYMRKSLKRYDPKIMSATALFLATKVEEVPRKLEYIVREYLKIDGDGNEIQNPITDDSDDFISLKQQILYYEGILLRTLCFDLAVDHPYLNLIQTVKNIHISHTRSRSTKKSLSIDLADRGKAKSLAQASWGFINDSLMTPLCIIHPPEVIAASAFLLAVCHRLAERPNPDSQELLESSTTESWLQSNVHHYLNIQPIKINDYDVPQKPQDWWAFFKVHDLQSVYESANVILDQYSLASSPFINQRALKIPRFPAPGLLPDSSESYSPQVESQQPIESPKIMSTERMSNGDDGPITQGSKLSNGTKDSLNVPEEDGLEKATEPRDEEEIEGKRRCGAGDLNSGLKVSEDISVAGSETERRDDGSVKDSSNGLNPEDVRGEGNINNNAVEGNGGDDDNDDDQKLVQTEEEAPEKVLKESTRTSPTRSSSKGSRRPSPEGGGGGGGGGGVETRSSKPGLQADDSLTSSLSSIGSKSKEESIKNIKNDDERSDDEGSLNSQGLRKKKRGLKELRVEESEVEPKLQKIDHDLQKEDDEINNNKDYNDKEKRRIDGEGEGGRRRRRRESLSDHYDDEVLDYDEDELVFNDESNKDGVKDEEYEEGEEVE